MSEWKPKKKKKKNQTYEHKRRHQCVPTFKKKTAKD